MKNVAYKQNGSQFVNLVSDEFANEVISSIYDCENEREFTNDSERIKFFTENFIDEFGWNLPRKGWLDSIEDYLRGIPSTISLPIYNNEILEMGHRLGDISEDELHRVPSCKMEDLEFYYIDEFYGRAASVILRAIDKEFRDDFEWVAKMEKLLASKI